MLVESVSSPSSEVRAGKLREGQGVAAALVLDLDVALLDVYVGLAVSPMVPSFDEVALGEVVLVAKSRLRCRSCWRAGLDRLLASIK